MKLVWIWQSDKSSEVRWSKWANKLWRTVRFKWGILFEIGAIEVNFRVVALYLDVKINKKQN